MPEFNWGYDYFPQQEVDNWYDGLNDCYENDLPIDFKLEYVSVINDEENDYLD